MLFLKDWNCTFFLSVIYARHSSRSVWLRQMDNRKGFQNYNGKTCISKSLLKERKKEIRLPRRGIRVVKLMFLCQFKIGKYQHAQVFYSQ